jgi:hypothetical protein
MSSSEMQTINVLNSVFKIVQRYILPVVLVLANAGNLFSALIFARKSWRKNVCVFYFNICLVFNTCYINSSMLGSMFIYGFGINLLNANAILCKLYTYTSFLFSTLTPTVLILASIDRLLISSQNVDTRLYSSKRLAYFSVSVSTAVWTVCFFICYYSNAIGYQEFVSYSSLIINSAFFVIMIILSITAFKNVRQLRAIPRHQRQQIRSMTKKDFQLLRCLFVQDVVYILFSVSISVYIVYAPATVRKTRTPLEKAFDDLFSNEQLPSSPSVLCEFRDLSERIQSLSQRIEANYLPDRWERSGTLARRRQQQTRTDGEEQWRSECRGCLTGMNNDSHRVRTVSILFIPFSSSLK